MELHFQVICRWVSVFQGMKVAPKTLGTRHESQAVAFPLWECVERSFLADPNHKMIFRWNHLQKFVMKNERNPSRQKTEQNEKIWKNGCRPLAKCSLHKYIWTENGLWFKVSCMPIAQNFDCSRPFWALHMYIELYRWEWHVNHTPHNASLPLSVSWWYIVGSNSLSFASEKKVFNTSLRIDLKMRQQNGLSNDFYVSIFVHHRFVRETSSIDALWRRCLLHCYKSHPVLGLRQAGKSGRFDGPHILLIPHQSIENI